MAQTMTTLLNKFDERVSGDNKIQMKVQEASTWNATTAETEPGAVSLIEVTGLVSSFEKNLIDGTTILHSDKRLVLSAAVEPLMDSKFIIDDKEYSTIHIDTIKYTSNVIGYSVQIRA